MNSRIALFDMDGTLSDYDHAMLKHQRAISPDPANVEVIRDTAPSHELKLREYIWKQPGFWEEQKILSSGNQVFNLMLSLGFIPKIVTKAPYLNDNAWVEKVRWARKYYHNVDILILSGSRRNVYGKVLVDDNLDNVDEWLDAWEDGKALIPTRTPTYNYKHPRAMHYYSISNLAPLDKIRDFIGDL